MKYVKYALAGIFGATLWTLICSTILLCEAKPKTFKQVANDFLGKM